MARSEEFEKEDLAVQGIIRIGREGDFDFQLSKDPIESFGAFLACIDLWKWQQKMKQNYFDRKKKLAGSVTEFDKDAPDIKAPTSSTGGQSSGAILEKI